MDVKISELLSQCLVSRMNTDILVICSNDEIFIKLMRLQAKLIAVLTASGNRWERIIVRSSDGEKKTTFYPPAHPPINVVKAMADSNILIIPEKEIIKEIMKCPDPSSLIRVEDDKGLFTNSHVHKSSGTTPNNWIGRTMSNYWIPEELERYKEILLKEKEVTNFKYVAYFFTGEAANFTVDARLVNFNGDLCRWVRVVQCDLIS